MLFPKCCNVFFPSSGGEVPHCTCARGSFLFVNSAWGVSKHMALSGTLQCRASSWLSGAVGNHIKIAHEPKGFSVPPLGSKLTPSILDWYSSDQLKSLCYTSVKGSLDQVAGWGKGEGLALESKARTMCYHTPKLVVGLGWGVHIYVFIYSITFTYVVSSPIA